MSKPAHSTLFDSTDSPIQIGLGKDMTPWLKYGLGAVLSAYLVWWMTAVAGAELKEIRTHVDDHVSASANAEQENGKFRRAMVNLAALNCKAMAHSQGERDLCDEVVREWSK